jgi:hypothetical protein
MERLLPGMSFNFVNLAGKRFGRLEVIGEVGRNAKGEILWGANCDCGNTTVIRSVNLKGCASSNRKGTYSCGCARWIPHPNRRRPDAGALRLFHSYRCQARRRGIAFELTFEQFKKLTSSPCFYTGRLPSQLAKSQNSHGATPYTYNGIDRLDNSKGYILENCVPCCGPVNTMKLSLPFDLFISLCREITENFMAKQ